jgi:hypothetical protein
MQSGVEIYREVYKEMAKNREDYIELKSEVEIYRELYKEMTK